MPTDITVTVRDLREHLSQHLHRVQSGGSVVVTARGQPVARLVPISPAKSEPRPFGFMKGQIRIADDFDDTPPEMVASVEADVFPTRRRTSRR